MLCAVTLIISVLTDDYVALVSDRRITYKRGGLIERQEDTDTKTFNLFGQFLMGFSGLARIDGLRIEAWASKILTGVPSHEYFNVLTREIGLAFQRLGHSGEIHHTFLAAGYASLRPEGRVYPMNVVISNCIDNQGNFTPERVSGNFRMYVEDIGNRRRLIRSAGWSMRQETLRALEHRIRVVSNGEPSNPILAVGPLVTAVRDTARHSKKHVGEAVLFSSLPRCAVPSPGIAMGRVDFCRTAAAIFLPEGTRNPSDAAVYAPACISPQLHVMGIKVYPGMRPPKLGSEEGWPRWQEPHSTD